MPSLCLGMMWAAAVLALWLPSSCLTSAADVTITQVNYTDTHDDTLLMGFVAKPDSLGGDEKRPGLVILPPWHGVGQYAQERMSSFAQEGNYVVLAADIFGNGALPETTEDRVAQVTIYRSNLDLTISRIESAINVLKNDPHVDPTRIALVGYCFGGTIGLMYAMAGHDASAVIAFHGSISYFSDKELPSVPVVPKVLILSGGEDTQDSTKSVIDMEGALNHGNATWQLTRYSDVEHGFTNSFEPAYNPYVDERSHDNAYKFLAEAFGDMSLEADVPDAATTSEVSYEDADGYALTGHVAYPPESFVEKPYPAVIVIHDASGPDEYEQKRATMLSEMGYVGFVADIFGDDHGYDLTNITEVFTLLVSIRDDVPLFVQRINAAIETVKGLDNVDPENIALIGYCFGGTGVISYALTGETQAKGIVSYHGGLSAGLPPVTGDITAKMLIESGGDDDASSSIEDLEDEMKSGNGSWEYSRYSGVVHAFTNWDDAAPFGVYDVRADVTSWDHTGSFLSKLFAAEASPPAVVDEASTDVPESAPEVDSPTDSSVDAPADESSAFMPMMALPTFVYVAGALGSLYIV